MEKITQIFQIKTDVKIKAKEVQEALNYYYNDDLDGFIKVKEIKVKNGTPKTIS